MFQTTLISSKKVIVVDEVSEDALAKSIKVFDRQDMTVDSVKNESPRTEKLYEPKI